MKTKLVVIGANGQLGSDLVIETQSEGFEVVGLTHQHIELSNPDSVRSVLVEIQPSIIINTGAYHNVPLCEQNAVKAFQVNAVGALNVARVAEDIGATNVYVSTDYVFDGARKKAYVEGDPTNPLNVYAASKLAGEFFTLNHGPRGYVFRVSGIYGRIPCRAKGGNFITTMTRLAGEQQKVEVVCDEILTPTPTVEIARASIRIVGHGQPGLYHVTCEGECSWYEFAQVIFENLGLKTPLLPTSVQERPVQIRRPHFSVLENGNIKKQGISTLPHWKDSLVSFLRQNYSVTM